MSTPTVADAEGQGEAETASPAGAGASPSSGQGSTLPEWARADLGAWLFVAKTLTAAFLALWIAYRFDIDNARSAMLTVFIVAQPQSGLVLAKSFYRIVGTLFGLVVTIAFLHWFAQARDLYAIAVTLWIGLCVAGAAYFRGFRSYGFLLAGYTTCLIGFPAVQTPQLIFPIALSRASDVLIGILCAGVVSDLVLPQQLSRTIVTVVRARFRDFLQFTRHALRGELSDAELEERQHHFVEDALALETLRAAAYFENPEVRVRDQRLRLFNVEFMAASTAMHGLHRWMERMRREQRNAVLDAMAPLYRLLSVVLQRDGQPPATAAEARDAAPRLAVLLPKLKQHAQTAADRVGQADRLDFACATDLLQRFAAALHDYTEAYGSLATPGARTPRRAPAFTPHVDPLAAAIVGLRAMVALSIVTLFWIRTAWPDGPFAALIAAVVCALFAQSPQPTAAVRQMGTGFVCGFLAMIPYDLIVLPQLDGFAMLTASLTPILMLSCWMMTQPRVAGIGTGFNLMFVISSVPANGAANDVVAAINGGLAQVLGVAVAGVAFTALVPANAALLRRRQLRELRQQVAFACNQPLPGLRYRLELRVRDLLIQLRSGSEAPPAGLLDVALGVLEIGDAIISLRECVWRAEVDVLTRRLLRAAGRALAQAYETPSPQTLYKARAALRRADDHLLKLLAGREVDAARKPSLEQIRRSVYRLDRSIRDDPPEVLNAA
jgi:uncharacterized membrane protein YccC